MDDPLRPGHWPGMSRIKVSSMRVLSSPLNEIQRDFAQRFHRGFDVARRTGGSPVNKIPKRVALHPLEIPGTFEARGINRAQSPLFFQLEQWIISQEK